jgi:hypothetical protein
MQNSEIEQYYFEMFRRDYPLPEGAVEYGDKPDVIVRGARTIGIEIRNFFLEDGSLPDSEQIQRKARESVVAEAHHLYQAQAGKKFELTFAFDRSVPIRDQRSVARKIADLAATLQKKQTRQLWRDDFRHIPELSFAYLNATEYPDARWRVSQVYDGVFMSLDKLRTIVEEKELKAKDYRPCETYWLLVVVDFMDMAQDQEIGVDRTRTEVACRYGTAINRFSRLGRALLIHHPRSSSTTHNVPRCGGEPAEHERRQSSDLGMQRLRSATVGRDGVVIVFSPFWPSQ